MNTYLYCGLCFNFTNFTSDLSVFVITATQKQRVAKREAFFTNFFLYQNEGKIQLSHTITINTRGERSPSKSE